MNVAAVIEPMRFMTPRIIAIGRSKEWLQSQRKPSLISALKLALLTGLSPGSTFVIREIKPIRAAATKKVEL